MSIIKAQTASLLAIALGFALTAPAFATTLDTETSADISSASMAAAEDSNATDDAVDSNDDATMNDTMAPEDEDNVEGTMDEEEDTTPTAE